MWRKGRGGHEGGRLLSRRGSEGEDGVGGPGHWYVCGMGVDTQCGAGVKAQSLVFN